MTTTLVKQEASRHRSRSLRAVLRALPWIAPTTILIACIVLYPAGSMFYDSTRRISPSGLDLGSVGLQNYATIFQNPVLPHVLLNTFIWVVGVVAVTVIASLWLAQFLNSSFPGRRALRLTVIIPWAASVVMTTTVFAYALNPFYGILNKFFVDVGILAKRVGFTQIAALAFPTAMFIAVFVSLPFTTYTILSGLQGIPSSVLEAARLDGAGRARTYFSVILPQLRPSVAVAVLINIINVFNSLPILKVITGSIPGNDADTTTTLIFKYLQSDLRIDLASALSVVNFLIILVIIAVYVWIVKPMRQVEE